MILHRSEVVYLEKIESEDASIVLRATAKVGQRNAANSCAVGKALLAQLPESELDVLFEEMKFVAKTETTEIISLMEPHKQPVVATRTQ